MEPGTGQRLAHSLPCRLFRVRSALGGPGQAQASSAEGILTIMLPRPKAAEPRRIQLAKVLDPDLGKLTKKAAANFGHLGHC